MAQSCLYFGHFLLGQVSVLPWLVDCPGCSPRVVPSPGGAGHSHQDVDPGGICGWWSRQKFRCVSARGSKSSQTSVQSVKAEPACVQKSLFLCYHVSAMRLSLAGLFWYHLVLINYRRRLVKSGKHQIISTALGHRLTASWQMEQSSQHVFHL